MPPLADHGLTVWPGTQGGLPPQDAAVEARRQIGAHLVHARPRENLRRGKAQTMAAAEIVVSVQAGQDIPIAVALRDRIDRRRSVDEVDPLTGGRLLLMHRLNADVAVQIAESELRPRLQGQNVFLDLPRLVEVVGVLEHDEVVVAVERLIQVDAENAAEARKIERSSDRTSASSIDERLQAPVLEHQIPFVDALLLVATSEVGADVDLLDEAADRLVAKARRPPRKSSHATCGCLLRPSCPQPPQGARSPSETWLASE